MIKFLRIVIALALAAGLAGTLYAAASESPAIGIVIMHGKGGSPTKFVADLARALEGKGYLVANLEMPWSGRRDYDITTDRAEEEIEAALHALRAKGAQKTFVAGHSQDGAFALHFAGKHSVDGIIAIAPGGDTGNRLFGEQLGATLTRARQLVADGKGDEKTKLADYEGRKGLYPVVTTPALYVNWFDPQGAMSMQRAVRAANPRIPILFIVAKNDYPGLRRANIPLFANFPSNPLTKMYESNSDHIGAPSASLDEIVRWTTEVARAASP